MRLSVLLSASLAALAPVASTETSTYITYAFDPTLAAGVSGSITAFYDDLSTSVATFTIDLDFSQLNATAIQAFDGNCSEPITSFKWHIHTKWNATQSSGAFQQCTKALTGNHYDPLHACGPNSEYAGSAECLAKVASYNCTPTSYASDPTACETGDLSGKGGAITLTSEHKNKLAFWTDSHYATPSENAPQWNIVLHAVCGTATPRIACAVGQRTDEVFDDDSEQSTEGSSDSSDDDAAPVQAY